MTFDEMLQQHHVIEAKPPQECAFTKDPTRAFGLGAVYKVDCPNGLVDHMHGTYIRILGIAQTRIRYECLTQAGRRGEASSFAPDSYFAECLRFAYRNLQEYTAWLAV